VMYAKVMYKPREPQIKSLEMFIDSDHKTIRAKAPGLEIKESAPLATADGKSDQARERKNDLGGTVQHHSSEWFVRQLGRRDAPLRVVAPELCVAAFQRLFPCRETLSG